MHPTHSTAASSLFNTITGHNGAFFFDLHTSLKISVAAEFVPFTNSQIPLPRCCGKHRIYLDLWPRLPTTVLLVLCPHHPSCADRYVRHHGCPFQHFEPSTPFLTHCALVIPLPHTCITWRRLSTRKHVSRHPHPNRFSWFSSIRRGRCPAIILHYVTTVSFHLLYDHIIHPRIQHIIYVK
jgi:hypothetical protein